MFYKVRDFANEQRSARIEELEKKVQDIERRYPAVERYIKSTQRLQKALVDIKSQYKPGILSMVKERAKKFLQRYI